MTELDPETFAQQAVLIGLVTKSQAEDAKLDSKDGSLDALVKSFLRKEYLTRWQVDKLQKNQTSGYFFGGCVVLFHIAEGTFARVYRGKKVNGDQPVAIKVLRNRFVSSPESIKQFNEEAEAGIRLVHPNIVRTYEFGEQDRQHYMIMEYVEGSNLRDFLRFRGRLSEVDSLPLMTGLVSALKYSNEQGITHRDIKGTNILIASNGTAKLVDFGLATIEGGDKKVAAAHGQRTVDYSALERSCGSPKGDPRSDIFFLGCVFYQMLTGQLPLPEVETADPLAKMLRRGINSIKPLRENPYAPSPELTRIIEKMMKPDLKIRYQNCEEILKDLEAYASQVASTARAKKVEEARQARIAEGGEADVGLEKPHRDDRKTVFCVEAQEEIRDAFRKTFTKMGYRVLLVSDPDVAGDRYREATPDAVIFDLDGLGAPALQALLKMHETAQNDGQPLTALVLLGPRQHDLAKNLPTDDRLIVLPKPVKMKEVQDAITRLVPVEA